MNLPLTAKRALTALAGAAMFLPVLASAPGASLASVDGAQIAEPAAGLSPIRSLTMPTDAVAVPNPEDTPQIDMGNLFDPGGVDVSVLEDLANGKDPFANGIPIEGTGRVFSPTGIALLKQWEGLELRGYALGDGMCTIGYGHAVPIAQRPDCTSWTITAAEAEAMLASDIQIYAKAVDDWFTRDFNQNQFDALTVWMYNVGTGVFVRYGWSTDPDDARITTNLAKYIFPAQFSAGLRARRAAEIALFNS
jgi:GH24 family phage-related lysozyme (muramidase)